MVSFEGYMFGLSFRKRIFLNGDWFREIDDSEGLSCSFIDILSLLSIFYISKLIFYILILTFYDVFYVISLILFLIY